MVRLGSRQVLLLGWRGQSPKASERRSRWSAVAGTSGPGYQAHIQCAGRPAAAGTGAPVPIRCGRLPWLASRGWSRVGARLPCPGP